MSFHSLLLLPDMSDLDRYRQLLKKQMASHSSIFPETSASNHSGSSQINTTPDKGEIKSPSGQAKETVDNTLPKNKTQDSTQDRQDQANPQDQYAQYYPQSQLEESQIAPWMYKPLPEEDVLEWIAPSRPFKKRNKKYFSTVAVIAILISLILGFAGQLAAISVVIAVSFLAYVFSVVPPQPIRFKITTWGIRVENNLYHWEELGRFWFDKKFDDKLMNIECVRFPNRLTILLGDQDQELIKAILSEVLLNQKPELTFFEKAAKWLQEKIPLDIEE